MPHPIDRRTFLASAAAAALWRVSPSCAATPAGVLAAQGALAARLVGQVAKGDAKGADKDARGMTVVSPASLAGALSVIALGGDPAWQQNLQGVLGFAKAADAADNLDALRKATAHEGADQPFASANAIVFDSGLKLKPAALDLLAKAGVRASAEDFSKPETLAGINAWVSERTKGKIPTILDALPRAAGLVALNALYFKDRWKVPFDPAETRTAPFRLVGGHTVQVPLMRSAAGRMRFRQNDRFVAADLPYATAGYSMVVVTTKRAPAPVKDFADLGAWLTGAEFADQPGEVALPRFDASTSIDLIPALAALGLKPSGALPGFSSDPLHLAKVQQRVVLKVDEEGTEAAAATDAEGTRMLDTSFVKMVADRPFMFALRDSASGLIIVAGYVADPGASAARPTARRGGRVTPPATLPPYRPSIVGVPTLL
jgi:serpin B